MLENEDEGNADKNKKNVRSNSTAKLHEELEISHIVSVRM